MMLFGFDFPKKIELSQFDIPTKDELSKELSEINWDTDDIDTIIDVLIQNAPSAGEIVETSGFNQQYVISCIHVAAAKGDLEALKNLIESGVSVNAENKKSAMPLAIASMYGHTDVVAYLISQGADLEDESYNGFTALNWAIEKGHTDVVEMLLKAGTNAMTTNNELGEHALIQATYLLQNTIEYLITHPSHPGALDRAYQMLNIIEMIGEFGNPDDVALNGAYDLPIGVLLSAFAPYIQDKQLHETFLQSADKMAKIDGISENYTLAKTFLNVFATGEEYITNLGNSKTMSIETDGYFGSAIAKLMVNTLHNLTQHYNELPKNWITTLESMIVLHEHAYHDAIHSSLTNTSNDAYERYLNGETVLLPSGWDGHFVIVGFSKIQQTMFVANAGERDLLDPIGITFHHIVNQDAVTKELFHSILNNMDPAALEFELLHFISDGNHIDVIETDPQTHGNCTYYSFKIAFEAAAFIDMLNQGYDPSIAHQQAHELSQSFELFLNHFVIEQLSQSSVAFHPVAYTDILNELSTQASNGDMIAKITHNHLHNYLTSGLLPTLHMNAAHNTPPEMMETKTIHFTDVLKQAGSYFSELMKGNNQTTSDEQHNLNIEVLDTSSDSMSIHPMLTSPLDSTNIEPEPMLDHF